MTLARIGVGTLPVASTGTVQILLRASHPPTGATVLIISLRLLQTPPELLVLAVGIVLLTAVGWLINRSLRVPMLEPDPVAPRYVQSVRGFGYRFAEP